MTHRTVRWNEYVPVEEPDADITLPVTANTSPTAPINSIGPTPLLQQLRERFTAVVVPFGVAAAFFGPSTETVRRRVRVTGGTDAPFLFAVEEFDDVWSYHAELLTRDDVRELERLWALPYPGPPTTEFRLSE